MLAVNEIGSSPADATNGIAPAESRELLGRQTKPQLAECPEQPNAPGADSEPALHLDADTFSHPRTDSQVQRRNGFQQRVRALLKPLIALATAPHVLVTALAVFAALIVASQAGRAINAKLEPIIAALKRI